MNDLLTMARTSAIATLAALGVPAMAQSRAYSGAYQANQLAAQQAFAASMRAQAAQMSLAAQRSQQEYSSRTQSHMPTTSSGSPSATTAGLSPALRAAGPSAMTVDSYQWSRFDPGSDYMKKLDRHPAAGKGTMGGWTYSVRHDSAGRYASGHLGGTARDVKTGTTIGISLSCDFGPAGIAEGGPLKIEIDHSHADATRGRGLTAIVLRAGHSDDRLAVLSPLSTRPLAWKLGAGSSRASGDDLAFQLKVALIATGLRVQLHYGDYYDRFDGVVAMEGLDRGFEKLAPCWTRFWDFEYAELKRGQQGPAAQVAVPAQVAPYRPPNPETDMARALSELNAAQPMPDRQRP